MIDLSTSTEIAASPETVWATLTDLAHFSAWNPFIRKASGTPAVGAELRLRVRPTLRVPLVFRPKVLVCERNRELRWRGHFISRWLASGEHSFIIEPIGDGRVRFRQREVFRGLLQPLVGRLVAREARLGFEAMNRALKDRAERAQLAATGAPVARS